MRLDPVYRLKAPDAKQRLLTGTEYDFAKLRADLKSVAFLAVCTNIWPAGLVPIFQMEKSNRFELRRQPARGQENSSEPLFFALPPPHDPDATRIAGRWECTGTRASGSREFFGWDLSVESGSIAGRFDQFTDFRFGRIAGGSFRSNQFDLRVEYIMDAYFVKGTLNTGKLTGTWTREDGSENGLWEATRPAVKLPDMNNVAPLYEWRRGDDARWYAIEGQKLDTNWTRATQPLCRVWLESNKQ
ncbi:MAG: hypothetical protein L0Y58_04880 [Verrucomicrobia subdivision 3 bacterium]|nr:hypothetical protein [Limisphaerales bacterium]